MEKRLQMVNEDSVLSRESTSILPENALTEPREDGSDKFFSESTPRFLPVLLSPGRLSFSSISSSVLIHGVFFWFVVSFRVAPAKTRLIDFETEKITYYKVSAAFPNISPANSAKVESEASPRVSIRLNDLAPTKGLQEASVRAKQSQRSDTILEQPNMLPVKLLPKLELPNILLKKQEVPPGVEPITASPELSRNLQEELQQNLTRFSPVQTQSPSLAESLPMEQSGQLAGQNPKTLNLESYSSQKLKFEMPVEPASVSPQLSQISSRSQDFGTGATPLVAPPVDDPKGSIQVQQLPAIKGYNLLVYSTNPSLPKGELAVPKVNSRGNLETSPIAGTGKGVTAGIDEIGKADINIPDVSIKSRVPPGIAGQGLAVVQAPVPPQPPLDKRKEESVPSFKDLLLSLSSPTKIPSLEETKKANFPVSPLEELERQGKPVYTAAINAPNFTSKRGSWIFRFAELAEEADNPHVEGLANNEPREKAHLPLTAPSATVKVDPKYSPEVIRDKVEGVVILFAILRKDGAIDPASVRVIRKLDPRLDVGARDALIRWKFKPSLRNGAPVDIQTEVTIPFYFRRDQLYP